MPTLTAELIAHGNPDYSESTSIVLPIANHVHKRIERFVYQQFVRPEAIPIAYLENKDLDSRTNLQFADRTWTIPLNSRKLTALRSPITVVKSSSYSSCYKDILASNQVFVDESGKTRPLFWRHDLPDNVVQCEMQRVSRGNKAILDSGFVIDLDNGVVYTNYQNYFDADTGAYRLFYLVCTDVDGNTFQQLLDLQPVAKEASWEDIDLTTGKLTDAYPVYSKERSGSGYTFSFSTSDTWYIRPLERSLIQLRAPAGREPTDPWFVRFTDGDLSANVNDAIHRYYVPEFDKQPFIPAKPIKFSPYEKLLLVNRSVVAATRQNLRIDPSNGLHLTAYIHDVEGVLIKVLTTDLSLEGVRYNDTNVFYESDKIVSWDNSAGLIAFGLEMHRSWSFSATYFYEADDYEYTLLDFNPLSNPDVFKYSYVFYMVPDADTEDRAIHHIKIDANGVIVEVSQSLGLSHPNFQLLRADNTYNADTVIGMKYVSDVDEDTFTTLYTAGYENDYAYGVLAEVAVLDVSLEEDQFIVDVRRPGAIIDPVFFPEAIRFNPKLLQSYLGYGEDGQEIPQTNVMVLKAPITLLEDYGGVLSQAQAEKLLRTHHPSANAAIIDWEFPASEIGGWSETVAQIDVTWTWEGPGLDYRLYRRQNPTGEWLLIHTESSPAEAAITYADTDVTGSEVWYYQVRIFNGSVEFPAGNSVGIKVR